MSVHPDMIRLDKHEIPDDKSEIRFFATMRNEALRLPYLLDYYRRMGVKRFFVVSNASTDDTESYLVSQPDCCVWHTTAPYGQANYGLTWINSMLREYGAGHWTVMADADELLVYPRCEQMKLPQLTAWLDSKGYEGLYTLMLDMYSDQPITELSYRQGEDFLSACSWFDRDYHFVRRFGIPFIKPAFPSVEPIGGPRARLCFPIQNTANPWPRLRVKLVRRFLQLMKKYGLINRIIGENPAPQSFKIPLVKWREDYGYITSHRLNPIRLAPMTGVLLHFKYFQDFSARVKDAVDNNLHYDGSAEYRRYAELLERDPRLSMRYKGSLRYQGSAGLVALKLMKSDPDWMNYA